ncbi:hypothetical protein BM449_08975 [Synechococcus sp. SynAce01]|nr:hypothetical protein BM449_08975 [Synechococcus sp. SynAce01]
MEGHHASLTDIVATGDCQAFKITNIAIHHTSSDIFRVRNIHQYSSIIIDDIHLHRIALPIKSSASYSASARNVELLRHPLHGRIISTEWNNDQIRTSRLIIALFEMVHGSM